MRITTRVVYQLTDDPEEFIELERESYEYDGPVAQAGGGGSDTTTQVQKADPWGPLQPYITNLLPNFAGAAQNIPEFYPGQTYADFDPLQLGAMGNMLGFAQSPMLNQNIANQMGAIDYGLTSVYDPESNPVLSRYVDSATRPLHQAYEEAIGNTIAGNALGAGGLGGSRQGVAEGLATRSYMDALSDTTADIYKGAYDTGLQHQARMAALAPQTMQAAMMPMNIMDTVGGRFQGQNQQAIDEAMNRYNYNENIEFSRLNDYFNTLMGQGFGSSTTTGPNPNQSNTGANMLGGALAGASLGSMLFPAGTMLGAGAAGMGLGTLGGAGIGALLPLLALSDKRTKTDIKKVGLLDDGLPVYTFKYKGGDATHMGVMAQELEKKKPEAVHNIGGVKMVDYSKVAS